MDKQDKIYNALLVGMTLEDAYIYAGLTADEVVAVSEDHALQSKWHSIIKGFEFDLLKRMNDISSKQTKMGKEGATTWMLEHMYPRYSGKPQGDVGTINLHITTEKGDDECVELHS